VPIPLVNLSNMEDEEHHISHPVQKQSSSGTSSFYISPVKQSNQANNIWNSPSKQQQSLSSQSRPVQRSANRAVIKVDIDLDAINPLGMDDDDNDEDDGVDEEDRNNENEKKQRQRISQRFKNRLTKLRR
jgi:hypothetical protein